MRQVLICLPPAGAGPGIFRPWAAADPAILAPSIPGREARFAEAPPRSLAALAEGVAADLAPRLPERFALFGYSMGGTVAVLVAQRLADLTGRSPEALFVLGALAPHALPTGTNGLSELPGAAFWEEIARIGGTPPEILADAEMRALLEPMIRADFALCDAYRHADHRGLACPIHVFTADEDHLLPPGTASDWARYTSASVHDHHIPGGHMLGPAPFARLRGRIRDLWPAAAGVR